MDRYWNRVDTFRLLARVSGLVLDGAGNAREGDVRFLDRAMPDGELSWFRWRTGACIHWHPFRVALLSTRRAGLHLVCEWDDGSGTRRYAQNHHLSRDGILVLSPCNVARLAEPVEEALADPVERACLDAAIRSRFGLNATDVRPTRRLWRLPEAEPAGPPGAWATHPLAAAAAA